MRTATAMLGPSPERLGKANEYDLPAVDDKVRRPAFRIIGVVEGMERDGRISREQALAFSRFERDLAMASRSGHIVCRYGEQSGCGGTPVSQLANDVLSIEERISTAHRKVAEAVEAIGEPRTVDSIVMAATKDTNLEGIGRAVLMIGNKVQAIATAARTLQMGTYQLARHYGMLDDHTSPRHHPPNR